jgi:hypothetical protein
MKQNQPKAEENITTEQVKKKIPNPTGKGGFKDHPELINAGGRPKNQQSFTYWLNQFKNMTTNEFLKWYKENPKSKRTIAAELAYNRIFNARKDLKEFREVANRTEGMPRQKMEVDSNVNFIIDSSLKQKDE